MVDLWVDFISEILRVCGPLAPVPVPLLEDLARAFMAQLTGSGGPWLVDFVEGTCDGSESLFPQGLFIWWCSHCVTVWQLCLPSHFLHEAHYREKKPVLGVWVVVTLLAPHFPPAVSPGVMWK